MLFIADIDWLHDVASGAQNPVAAVSTTLATEGIAVASASIPALHDLLLRHGATEAAWAEILAAAKIVKTPSYIDPASPLARQNPAKHLLLLAAQAVGGKVMTTDPTLLAHEDDAVRPDAVAEAENQPMAFCNLKRQYEDLQGKIEQKLDRVLTHGQFINGPEVKELEEACATATEMKHAIACASGTDALLLALMAYDVGPGNYVVTTPFTFIATAEVVSLLGARPLFVDIDPETYNICPRKLAALLATPTDPATGAAISSERIRGVIAVDLFGQTADYDALREVIGTSGLFLIEDGAQSYGAQYKGRPACSLGDISTTSFFPAKPLGCYGDGGMIFTADDALGNKMRQLLNHGQTKRYTHTRIGINGRLDTLQAAILLAKLETFHNSELGLREEVAASYSAALAPAASAGAVILPTVREYAGSSASRSAWAQYSIQIDNRSSVQEALAESGIPTAVHYPVPLHLQPAFAELGYRAGDFPVSEAVSARIMSLPMDPWKTSDEIAAVAAAVITVAGAP